MREPCPPGMDERRFERRERCIKETEVDCSRGACAVRAGDREVVARCLEDRQGVIGERERRVRGAFRLDVDPKFCRRDQRAQLADPVLCACGSRGG